MLLKAHCAILATLICVATVLPASAQGFNKEELKRARASLPDIGRPYSIRVTTGATTNAGFEQALTQTDPNLKHWCWIPVSSMNQAYIRVGAGQDTSGGQPAYRRPKSVYVKPVKVALPKVDHGDYPTYIGRRGSSSSADVTAKVTYSKNPVPRSYEGQQRVATYSNVSGRLTAPRYTAANYGESRDVYGKLVTRSTTH